MEATLNDLFVLIPQLNPAQRAAVSARLAAAGALPAGRGTAAKAQAVQGTAFTAALYEALAELLKVELHVDSAPYNVFISTKYGAHYLPAAGAAEKANAKWFPDQTKAEQISMCRLYARLIIKRHRERGLELAWPVLTATIGMLPVVVDTAFPGYARCGMLGLVQGLRVKQRA